MTPSRSPGADRVIEAAALGGAVVAAVPRVRGTAAVEAAGIGAGILAFSAIVSGRAPEAVAAVGPETAVWLVAAVLFVAETAAFVVALRRGGSGRWSGVIRAVGRAVLAIAIFVATALPLAAAWQAGSGGYFAIGGMLPWSDASNYYEGAVQVKDHAALDFWNQRRPLNAALNSVKLRIGGGVMGWVTAAALLLAIALFLATRELSVQAGLAAAAVFVATVCRHGADYWITTMSEPNGLLLGLLAATMFLASIRRRSAAWFLAGMFALGVALEARAGAFFILPCLWVWGAVTFGESLRRRIAIGVLAIFVTLLAFVPARVYDAQWGKGRGVAHANFAPTLYGLAAGNKGWRQVFEDHPQLETFRDEARTAPFIYERAFELIREHPLRFAGTLAGSALLFVADTGSYVAQPAAVTMLVLLLCLMRRRERLDSFVLAVFLGVIASAPLLIRDGGSRVFSATLPLTALSMALAVASVQGLVIALAGRIDRSSPEGGLDISRLERGAFAPAVAAALVASLLLAPLALAGRTVPPKLPRVPHSAEGTAVAFVPWRSGEWVDVFPDREGGGFRTPRVRASGVVEDIGRTQMSEARREVQPPMSVGVAVDLRGAASHGDTLTWFFTQRGRQLPRTARPLLLVGEDRESRDGYHYMVVRGAFVAAEDGSRWVPLWR